MNELAEKIAQKIHVSGPMCFAEFMDLALYCPNLGYYEGEKDRVGRGGDFYTSVSAGQVFGNLLAFQIAEWSRSPRLGLENGPLQIVEAGAHRGDLARDILSWMQRHAPDVFDRLDYWIVGPSSALQSAQKSALTDRHNVTWANDLEAVAKRLSGGVRGIILSNELLDAMPVHRVSWDKRARRWFEFGVTLEGGTFAWERLPVACPAVAHSTKLSRLPPALADVLPDGFSTEVESASPAWWTEASRALARGYLVTFDYGLEWDEFFTPHRANGTLRGYRKHQYVTDILQHPGFQDITAHVDFTAIREAGEAQGLHTLAQMQQSKFLVQLTERYLTGGFPTWTAAEIRQFRTITHPEGLGRALQVLVQERR